MTKSLLAAIAIVCALAHTSLCNATTIFNEDFQLNGDASTTPTSLLLTSIGVLNDTASAFRKKPIELNPTAWFKAHFGFRILGGPGGADGFTFTIQNGPAGLGFLGVEGGNLGFYSVADGNGKPVPFGPARAVAFDTFLSPPYGDADDNHVSTLDDTTYQLRKQVPVFWDLNSGDELFAWVYYDELAKTLSVYLNNVDSKPLLPLLTDTMDLYADLGVQAFVGFTAATGGLTNQHEITSFQLTTQADVPEPGTCLLSGLGLALLATRSRRRA